MGPAHLVMDIADRHVQWMELLMPGDDGHGCLVCAEDDRHEHGSMDLRICSESVLDAYGQLMSHKRQRGQGSAI